MTSQDEYKSFIAISGNFSHAKPSIKPDDLLSNVSKISTYSHPSYNFRTNEKIDAADYYAATELGAKFKSRESIYSYFNLSFSNISEATC